jgi:hypothetical protein
MQMHLELTGFITLNLVELQVKQEVLLSQVEQG